MRLRIDLAYDGTDFRGWATQPGLRTVEGDLTAALNMVLRRHDVSLVCAGRTDSGVHARGQVVHTDLPDDGLPDGPDEPARLARLARRLNGVLSKDVRVRRVVVAPDGFDARYGALWRRYAYRIADAPDLIDPLRRAHVLPWQRRLDLDRMNAAAALLVGHNDFAAFCKQRPGATTIRTLLDLTWARDDTGIAVATVRADAFCHSMVRALVGCLLPIGEGRRPIAWAGEVMGAGIRDPVAVAHAEGLTLEEVAYPADDEVAARAILTRRRRVE